MSCDEITSFSKKITSAIGSLDALIASLMSTEQISTTPMDRKHLLFAHHLTNGAQMLLHRILVNGSEGRCLAAAISIFKLATSVPSYSPGYVDPFIGVSHTHVFFVDFLNVDDLGTLEQRKSGSNQGSLETAFNASRQISAQCD